MAGTKKYFRVIGESWVRQAHGKQSVVTGYVTYGSSGAVTVQLARDVFGREASIHIECLNLTQPVEVGVAQDWLRRCCGRRIVAKRRHMVPVPGATLYVDVYYGKLRSLTLASVELPEPEHEFWYPEWLGAEVIGPGNELSLALCGLEATHGWWERAPTTA